MFKRKNIYPDFYNKFQCKADACSHTCCAGWEIDIDDLTADYYYKVKGEFGDELISNIHEDGAGFHFSMKDDKCPFLNEQGLCRIILNLDEDALCDICSLHPRFFQEIKRYDLCGLGLSCEKVCELLLTSQKPLTFIEENSGIAYTLSGLLSLLGTEVPDQNFTFTPTPDPEYYASLIGAFSKTEPIDEAWTSEINILKVNAANIAGRAADYANIYNRDIYNRIFSYILYRQIELIADHGLDAVEKYAKDCTEFIFLTDSLWGDTAGKIRRFSEQIEYSTKNVKILLGNAE